MDRRTFFIRSMGVVFALSAQIRSLPVVFAEMPKALLNLSHSETGLSEREWQIIETVQNHLLPSAPGEPGARDVNAVSYLRFVLTDPKLAPTYKTLLKKGLVQLEGIAMDLKGKRFLALSTEDGERVLRLMEATQDGRQWISEILQFILEALLGDPVYGGNPDGIGWKWLDHIPGFPRPPASRKYLFL